MILHETNLRGAYIIHLEKHEDDRGFFARSFCMNEFRDQGIEFSPVQANMVYTKHKNTLRGLHYQVSPYDEIKLVHCVKGAVYDVALDLNPESPTYSKWQGVELSEDNDTMFLIPKGCAHGYQTLSDNTEIFYLVSQFYNPDFERGVRWNDPVFNITWPAADSLIISEKDKNWPYFKINHSKHY